MTLDNAARVRSSDCGSAFYEIWVQGLLDASWSPRMGDLTIENQGSREGGDLATVLKGPLPDQSALLGVLNTLADRRICLLSMRRIETSI